jgi:ADP-ribose pyrophosphatase
MSETQITSNAAFNGKLIKVRVDTVRTESGREATREVVEHPGAVAILPVTDDGRLILVRQFRYAIGRAILEVPAGTREAGEADEVTAVRELREEVGVEADKVELLARYFISPGWCNEQITIYRATGLRDVGVQPDQDEVIELVTISPDDLPTLIASGEIADAKTITAILLARQ